MPAEDAVVVPGGLAPQMHNVSMTELSVLGPPISTGAPTLVEGIQFALRDAIARGALPAGFRLREIPLAAHFGCSTTPVREAIRRLENEGLVKIYPRRGAEITSVSSTEVEHLYETRMVLETYAVRKAAENKMAETALTGARQILAEQQSAIDRNEQMPLLDAEFHREITDLTGNPVIAELVEKTVRQIEAVQARSGAVVKGENERTCKAHTAIVTAVAKGNADRAESLMRGHLERAQQVVTASLNKQATTGA